MHKFDRGRIIRYNKEKNKTMQDFLKATPHSPMSLSSYQAMGMGKENSFLDGFLRAKKCRYYFDNFLTLSIVYGVSMRQEEAHEMMFIENLAPPGSSINLIDENDFEQLQKSLNIKEVYFIKKAHSFLSDFLDIHTDNDPITIDNEYVGDFINILKNVYKNQNNLSVLDRIKNNEPIDFNELSHYFTLNKNITPANGDNIKNHILHYALQENYKEFSQLCSHSLFKNTFETNKEEILSLLIFSVNTDFINELIQNKTVSQAEIVNLIEEYKSTTAVLEFNSQLEACALYLNIDSTPNPLIAANKKKKSKL